MKLVKACCVYSYNDICRSFLRLEVTLRFFIDQPSGPDCHHHHYVRPVPAPSSTFRYMAYIRNLGQSEDANN